MFLTSPSVILDDSCSPSWRAASHPAGQFRLPLLCADASSVFSRQSSVAVICQWVPPPFPALVVSRSAFPTPPCIPINHLFKTRAGLSSPQLKFRLPKLTRGALASLTAQHTDPPLGPAQTHPWAPHKLSLPASLLAPASPTSAAFKSTLPVYHVTEIPSSPTGPAPRSPPGRSALVLCLSSLYIILLQRHGWLESMRLP